MTLDTLVRIPAAGVLLGTELSVPDRARGVVMLAHRTAGSHHRPRHRLLAIRLRQAGLATVLTDLLTPAEAQADQHTGAARFDTGLLATRLTAAVDWLHCMQVTTGLPVGLLGAGTGAAAALRTAASRPDVVRAVVSRAGLPHLAGPALSQVRCPTLLIVRGSDRTLLPANQHAAQAIPGPCELRVIPGTTRVSPDPGALEQAAVWATEWFTGHLCTNSEAAPAPGA